MVVRSSQGDWALCAACSRAVVGGHPQNQRPFGPQRCRANSAKIDAYIPSPPRRLSGHQRNSLQSDYYKECFNPVWRSLWFRRLWGASRTSPWIPCATLYVHQWIMPGANGYPRALPLVRLSRSCLPVARQTARCWPILRASPSTTATLPGQLQGIQQRQHELSNLMARASEGGGGALIGTMAYRTDYERTIDEEKVLRRVAAEKNCNLPPPAPSVAPTPPASPAAPPVLQSDQAIR
jgi:hypothetical protein